MWLGVAIPVVIAGYVVSFILRRRALQRFAPGQEETLSRDGSLAKRAVKATFMVLALGLLLAGLTRPQYGGKEKMLRVKGLDIVFVLDFSKSMYAQDIKPDRTTMLKQEVMAFLDELTGDRVGVVAFAGESVRFPLTTDYEAVRLFLRDMTPADMPVGGTQIAPAIQSATELLTSGYTKKKRSKVMIVVTDGEDHAGGVEEAALEARGQGVRIYTLGIGTGTPELIPKYLADGTQDGFMRDSSGSYVTTALSDEAEDVLAAVAKSSGGTYTRSSPGKISLPAVEREIRKLKQSELKARKVTIYEEFYIWFLIPALILLVLETVPGDARTRLGELLIRVRKRKEES
jgi:Ca-activated chloride channel family protein